MPPAPGKVKNSSISDRAATLIATWFGVGYGPLAPGTWATLATIPLAWWLGRQGGVAYVSVALLLALLGIWAADVMVRLRGAEDPQIVVIDEVAGYLWTLALVPRDGLHLAMGFVVFRLLDITKPGPIGWLDRNVHGGLGVVVDDLLAGVVGALILVASDATGTTAWLSQVIGL